jgi:ribA/ribD-fused uncharacterized protein
MNTQQESIHEDGKFHFFWNGVFSQWHPSEFVIESGNKVGNYDYGSITFNCAEQYMMFKKAALFGDKHAASLILQATDPKVQKKLGREVQNFDVAVWEQECGKIVYDGNYAKFTQNPSLYRELMNTGNAILVEASPYDTVWGIGLDEATAKVTPVNEWKGTNWLGEVLTQLKLDLEWEEEKRLQSVAIEI